ncbi:GtrA family protein [Cupriavidus alkaliphilus]|uniref:GtrA family protein n=1 Tax=Cupriavidus alkaliphilus TaxID=942866 RepID=UPI000DC5A092|nr:GtrA family protein [Cupriavidus alkaliphilus]MBB3011611.1 putative flippase GtrA [Cupriavidus alkaliphilus]RAS11267.1 putative flippase GtrA [Cupriavidus alkaliphilus]
MLQKVVRFGVSGGIATAVHFSVAWAVFSFLTPRADIANGVAFVVANIFSYVLHTLWSFSSSMSPQQFARFIVVSLVGLGISTGVPALLGAGRFWLSTGTVLVAVPACSFLLHNFWTYRR